MSAQGKDDKVPFRIKNTLQKITGEDVEVYFIRDGDGLPEEWRKKLFEFAKSKKVKLILLTRHEIESYLLNHDLIGRVLAEEGNTLEKDIIKRLLVESMKDAIGLSRHGFDRTLRDNLYKTGRLMNAEYSYGDAEKEAAQIRRTYEDINNFDDLVIVAPAKESLSIFNGKIQSEFGLQISEKRLKRALVVDDLDVDLIAELKDIKNNTY